LGKVESAIDRVLGEVQSGGFRPGEMEKAVRMTLSHALRLRSTTRGMASVLAGSWLSVGDLDYDRAYLGRVGALGMDDLVAVARRYVTGAGCNRVSLHPHGTLGRAAGNGAGAKRGGVQKFELRNGLTLLVNRDARLPLVALRAQFLAGVPLETEATAGVTQVA